MMMARHIFAAVIGALTMTAVSAGSYTSPPADDQFAPGCTLPFSAIQDHHTIDATCPNEGREKAGSQNVAANEEQNRTKNNFCQTGTPAEVTQLTFKSLQTKTDALSAPFTYGDHDHVPADRAPIRASGFYTTSNGDEVHEGTLVRTVAFLLHGAYSDTTVGESVNCYTPGSATNDIHLALVKSKPTASTDECQSFTAEITPHFRPADWLILSTLHKTKTKTTQQVIANADLARPLRITGQMMLDGSHRPCRNGSGSPERISVWEIHPIYAIDVCQHTTLSTCRIGTDTDWQSLADWVQSQ